MLSEFTAVARQIASTTKKNEKEKLLAEYLRGVDDATLERAVVFFAGGPFPSRDERVTGVGWATIAEAAAAATGVSREKLGQRASHSGDLGDGIAPFFPVQAPRPVTVVEVGEVFDELAAASGSLRKGELLRDLFSKLDGEGARFVAKILQGEFRIGLQQGLVEGAIGRAFSRKLADVRRAQMFTGDLGVTALLARSDALDRAAMQLFHPLGFMLAQPEEDPQRIVETLGSDSLADDKYDGIRAQIHSDGKSVKIYSRTLDEISARFPEVARAALDLGRRFILDGEIVAFRNGILPFATLQTRIGRRKLSAKLLEEAPATFFAFDLLLINESPIFEEPLTKRLEQLRALLRKDSGIRVSTQSAVRDAAHVDALFDAARARGNEGLVVKAADSLYTPGRRGKSWLKYKKALATLDCVVTAAEYGHGKRRGVLSDYTFAIRSGEQLLTIGKAYSGLTDAEIEQYTKHFQGITTARHGPVHLVRPEVVVEIAFDRIQESKRHKSGFAMRFPRIARIRDDKSVDEISTIDEVRRIYEGQLKREEGALNEP
ncbi:MAG: ATP-dependent DNA ligase [Acidobacteriota bacterium]